MKFIHLANRNLKEVYRDPVSILLGLIMPIILLVLFSSIRRDIQLDIFTPQFLTPGIIVFCFSFLIMFSGSLLAKDRNSAFLLRLFTSPLRPSDFILSYLTPFVPLAFLQAFFCLIVGILLGASFENIGFAFIILLVFSIICISIGIIIGSFFSVNQVSGIGSLLITIFALFSGAWMDLKMIGGIFDKVGYLLPFAHAVDATRIILSGGSFNEISLNLIVISLYAFAFFVLAILSFKWAMNNV